MCFVSMIADHYGDKWTQPPYQPQPLVQPFVPLPIGVRIPTKEEIDEFHALLKKARAYDKAHDQPDCEIEEKKAKLLKLADELGITISFDEATT